MSARQALRDAFARFEHHQFPGYPDSPALGPVYDELVEQGGRLVGLIQRLCSGERVGPDEIPAFAACLPDESDDPECAEFRRYRGEIDRLRDLLRKACEAAD